VVATSAPPRQGRLGLPQFRLILIHDHLLMPPNWGREKSSRDLSDSPVFPYFPFESTSSGGPVTIMPWASKTFFNPFVCLAV
jgi:hypothetical protein